MPYNVKFTDKNKPFITVDDDSINIDRDIALLGRTKLEYGRDLNANLLHILENFASEENPVLPGTPDLSRTSTLADTSKVLLSSPVEGQLWWNKTQNVMFSWNGTEWVPMSMRGDIGVNWGVLCSGEQIPKPVSASGYVFPYSECVWIVSPKTTTGTFDYMLSFTDENAFVTMEYGAPDGSVRHGAASFMIVGIRGNVNLGGIILLTPPEPTVTPTATPVGTPPVTPTSTPPTTPGTTPPSTPPVTATPVGTPPVTGTPAATPTGTPPVTPTGTPPATPTPTPTVPPPVVVMGDFAISGLSQTPAAASASVLLNSNGTYNGSGGASGTWLVSGTAAQVEVFAAHAGTGVVVTNGTFDTWISLGSSITLEVSTETNLPTAASGTISLTFRNASTLVTLDTATVTYDLIVENN